MEVAPGVHRIHLGFVNAYLVTAEDGCVLIDTGLSRSGKDVARSIERIGRKTSDVRWIVLTHADLDHVGGVARLKELSGARVAIHERDAFVLERAVPRRDMALMRAMFAAARFRPTRPDVLLHGGDQIAGLGVVHTPGHSAGSITLVRGDGVVFCGDSLRSDRHGNLEMPDPRLSDDMPTALLSAERIRALQPTLLLPGHGAPVRM